MKILIVTTRIPFPLKDGGAIQGYTNTMGYVQQQHQVTMFALATPKHGINPAELPTEFTQNIALHTTAVNTNVRLLPAFFNLFTKKSYNITRFFSPEANAKLQKLLQTQTFDIIHLESPYIADYLPTIQKHSHAKIILRAHNVEHIIWKRMSEKASNLALKWYFKLCAKRLYIYEKNLLNQVDAVVAITPNDQKMFVEIGCKKPIFVSSGGANIGSPPNFLLPQNHAICFIASLDWLPNIEGLNWFLEQVLPKIIEKNPNAVVNIAGRNMPQKIAQQASKNIKIWGEIDHAQTYMQQNGILIVPLLSGSGMRIKLVEAMALGKAIVSTSVGAEGVCGTHLEHYYIADTPQTFADACLKLLQNPEICTDLGKNAYFLAKTHYDNQKINAELCQFYATL